MTDLSTPGEINAAVDNVSTAHAIEKAGGHSGYIVDGTDISEFYSDLSSADIDGFAYQGSTGLDVTVAGGEAFCAGWFCRDRMTTVTLDANTTTTVYAGFDLLAVLDLAGGESPADNENVIIGPASAFPAESPRLALYEFTTDGSSVTASEDLRALGDPNMSGDPLSDEQVTYLEDFYVPISGGTFTGETTVDADLLVFGNQLYSSGEIRARDGLSVENGSDADVSGNAYIHGNLVHFGTRAQFDGDVDIGGNFTVDGTATLGSTTADSLDVSGGATVDDDLYVDGPIDNSEGRAVVANESMKIYVQDTEPSGWLENDIWIKPE